MRRTITFFVLMVTYTCMTWAYDFSSVAPSGQTLYYTIHDDSTTVTVTSGNLSPSGTLTIPDSVTHNGQTYTVTRIGDEAFMYCHFLSTVAIPSTVTSIGNSAFYLCDRLTSVTIPNTVTSIGDNVFEYCESLTSVTIPDSLTTLGISVFDWCRSLASITIPNSVTTICNYAFFGCESLTTITIPNSVTTIGKSVFYGCHRLATVTIGSSVTTIGESAFASTNIQSVLLKSTIPPQIQASTFNVSASHPITFQVPCGTTETYRNTAIWGGAYYQYIEDMGCPVDVIGIVNDTNLGTVMGSGSYLPGQTATLTATPKAGSHFEAWLDGNTENPRYITIDSADSTHTYIANFEEDTYFIVIARPSDTNKGTVTGSGYYLARSTAMLSATPKNGSRFAQWSDGDSTNPRAHYVASDTNLIAIFRTNPDPIYVHDTTLIPYNDTIEIHDSVVRRHSYYELNILSDNLQWGVVSGNGRFPDSTRVEIAAIPIEGYRFEQWQDGNSDNPRVVHLIGADATYIAIFEPNTQTIGRNQTDNDVTITTHDGQITVTNVANRTVRLFDSVGHLISTCNTHESTCIITQRASGVYLLQVGTAPARRIVIEE